MIHFKYTPLVLLLLVALLLAGCGDQGGQATPTAAAVTEEVGAAADSAQEPAATVSPLAAPDSPLAANSPLPTPAEDPIPTDEAGSIVGRILIVKPEGEIAVADMLIGLAEVLYDEEGVAKVGGYEPSRAVRVQTDAYGRFVMNNVKPGTYTLILDAVVQQYQLADEETGNTIMAEVKAGEVTDLGTLNYSSLPVPGFG